MIYSMDFDNIAISCASAYKKKFPKLDYDDLLQEARLIILKADVDESKDTGEIAKYLKNLVNWRIQDVLRKEKGLRFKPQNKINLVSYDSLDSDDCKVASLDDTAFTNFKVLSRRKDFLEEVRERIDVALIKSKEMQLLYQWVFVDGLTERQIAKKTGVSLRIVCLKRQNLLDVIRLHLLDLRV